MDQTEQGLPEEGGARAEMKAGVTKVKTGRWSQGVTRSWWEGRAKGCKGVEGRVNDESPW